MLRLATKPSTWLTLGSAVCATLISLISPQSALSTTQANQPSSSQAPPSRTHRLSRGQLSIEIETEVDRLTDHFGPRFDRTAVIQQVVWKDQRLVGPWGLADEFGLHGMGVLGFETAEVGEPFVKIGIGVLIKDQQAPYAFSHPYPIASLFPIEVMTEPHQLSVVQQTPNDSPWPYRYEKTYRLVSDHELQIDYALTNLGVQAFSIEHYNHHWFLWEGEPMGKAYAVATGFDLPQAPTHLLMQSRHLSLPGSLAVGEAQYYASDLSNVGANASTFQWQIHGQPVLRFQSSQSADRFALYADVNGFCPEVFTRHTLAPEQTIHWSATYSLADSGGD
jgi:hypothetical protein